MFHKDKVLSFLLEDVKAKKMFIMPLHRLL